MSAVMINTKKWYFENLISIAESNPELFNSNDEWVKWAKHELELLDKPNAKKIEAQAEDNNKLIDAILALGGKATAMDVVLNAPAFAGVSTQKIASIASRLIKDGALEKSKGERGTEYILVTNSAG